VDPSRAAPPDTPFLLTKQGATILLAEQNAKVALKLADYGYVLETGKIVIEGDGATLRQDETIVKAYLGGGSR
jgi:branched-chain amino acid transport system ATP-binding protein